jgi:hypothetical protein
MPYELALFSFKDDHFMRKKFSKEFWDEQGKLLFIPLASNYTELKPKNILIILYFIPFGGDMVNFRNFGVKRSFQSLFKIFFPIVDMVQENIREYEISESSPTHIVDEVFAYFNDRRSYHQYEIENVDDEFIVINFTLRANNIAEHSISLHYLLAKIQKFLSTASKILRHSFDKGHIILKGRDCANLEKIKFIMSGHNDPVTWKIKRFPEFGKNLFNYQ